MMQTVWSPGIMLKMTKLESLATVCKKKINFNNNNDDHHSNLGKFDWSIFKNNKSNSTAKKIWYKLHETGKINKYCRTIWKSDYEKK